MKPWKRVGVAAALIAGVAQWGAPEASAQEEEPSTSMDCFRIAEENTLLDDGDAIYLCCGRPSAAPVECFASVTDETTIDDIDALQLCQCASDSEPLRCFNQAVESAGLKEDEAITLCKATATAQYPYNFVEPD